MRRMRDRTRGPDQDPIRWAEVLREANLPERYWTARSDALRPGDLRQWVEHAEAHPEEWLYTMPGRGWLLLGELNSGKSSLAAILLMEALRRCETGLWLAAREVPGVMFRDGERAAALHDRLQVADLLVVDDLGSEGYRADRPGGAALEGAIRTLYDRGRPIIVTGNLNVPTIQTTYPAAIVSVLTRVCSVVEVENDQWGGPQGRAPA